MPPAANKSIWKAIRHFCASSRASKFHLFKSGYAKPKPYAYAPFNRRLFPSVKRCLHYTIPRAQPKPAGGDDKISTREMKNSEARDTNEHAAPACRALTRVPAFSTSLIFISPRSASAAVKISGVCAPASLQTKINPV